MDTVKLEKLNERINVKKKQVASKTSKIQDLQRDIIKLNREIKQLESDRNKLFE